MEGNLNRYIRVLNIWRSFGIHNAHVVMEWFELLFLTCVLFWGEMFLFVVSMQILEKNFFSKMTGAQELCLLRGTVQEPWPPHDPMARHIRAALKRPAWSRAALFAQCPLFVENSYLTPAGWSCLQKITAPNLSDILSVYGKW